MIPDEAIFPFATLAILAPIGVLTLVNAGLLIRDGQSLGKRAVGIRIVGADGGAVTPFQILFLRFVAIWLITAVLSLFVGSNNNVFGIVDLLFAFRADRRCLHDHLAGTVVIRDRDPLRDAV